MSSTSPATTNPSDIPLAANPSGAPPNFTDSPTLLPALRGVGISLAIVATCLVSIRVVSNTRSNRGLWLDDISCIIALVMAISYTGVVSSMGVEDTTREWDTPLSSLNASYTKKIFVVSLFYGPMLFFAKASILLLYHRVFQQKISVRIAVYVTLAILFASYFMTVPLSFVYCMPHNGRAWDLNILTYCGHLEIPGLVQGAINIAADVVIFIIPLPVIYRLNMSMRKKVGVTAMFATGLFALVASILTMYYRTLNVRGVDSSWTGTETYICIQAEVYVAISVACMPALARFWNTAIVETKLYSDLQSVLHAITSMPTSLSRSRRSQSSRSKMTGSETSSTTRVNPSYELENTPKQTDKTVV